MRNILIFPLRYEVLQDTVAAALRCTTYMATPLLFQSEATDTGTLYHLPPPPWAPDTNAGAMAVRRLNEQESILEVIPPYPLKSSRSTKWTSYFYEITFKTQPPDPDQAIRSALAAYQQDTLDDSLPDHQVVVQSPEEITRRALMEYHLNLVRAFLVQLKQDPALQDLTPRPAANPDHWLGYYYMGRRDELSPVSPAVGGEQTPPLSRVDLADDGSAGVNEKRETHRGLKVGTLDRVKEAHRLAKAGVPLTKACQRAHTDTRTYQQWCHLATGEEPLEPFSAKK